MEEVGELPQFLPHALSSKENLAKYAHELNMRVIRGKKFNEDRLIFDFEYARSG